MTALEAHARLLATLPVRTHDWQPPSSGKGGRPTQEQTRWLHKSIMKLKALGCSRQEIAKELDVSLVTVTRHCRAP